MRVLILEDVPADARSMVDALRDEGMRFDWKRVETEQGFLEQLETVPDLILADVALPKFNGLSALKIVRSRNLDIPFIVVSGRIDEDAALAAMRRGADDFILKDRMARLGPAVVQVVARRRLRSEAADAEQAQRESEARFRQIAEHIQQVFWLTDPERKTVLYISPAYETVWGRSREALQSSPRSWVDTIHPADRDRMIAAVRKNQQGGNYAEEYRIVRPDGSVRWILERAFPVRDEAGRVYRIAGLAEDITDRRQAERRRQAQYAVARVLSEAENFAEATPRILEAIATNLNFQTGILWEVDAESEIMICVDVWHSGADNLETLVASARDMRIARGHGSAGSAWESAKPVWVRDATDLPAFSSAPAAAQARFQSAGLHGAVAFPIILHGAVRGVADFFSAEVLEPEPALLDTLDAIGSQIGQFLDRRRQQESIERLNRIHALLSGINSIMVRTRDRMTLFQECCRIPVETGGFSMALVLLLDLDNRDLRPIAWRGEEQDVDLFLKADYSARDDVVGGRGTVGMAIRTEEVSVCNDLTRERDLGPTRMEAVRRGYRSVVSLPLFTVERCIGVLVLYSRDVGWFDELELGLLKELAEDISYALDFIHNEQQLLHLAYHDPLTGLPNRTRLHGRLKEVVETARETGRPFAVLLMNINHFRDINDTLGHANGDLLLHEVAGRISRTLWQSDMVACLGGDEFAMLLDHLAAKSDIDMVIAKIARVLQVPITVAGLPVSVEVRLGIAIYPDHGETADVLWQHADIALRAAKTLQQNQLIYNAEIDHYKPDRLALIGGLRKAIDKDELTLHFQPKLDVQRRQAVGVEALVRWEHPERGLLGPDTFVPLAERTDLIHPLSKWVLGNAMRQQRRWSQEGLMLRMAVNVSVRNLQDQDFVAEILELAKENDFILDALTVEITESAIMVDPTRAFELLMEMTRAGIRIAVDDFGIGHSSLAYLKDLPVDEMKIDKSFIMNFTAGRNTAIVRSAIELAHHLGLKVTAEGVEDEAVFLALGEMGCDLAQGYYFSRPLPASQIGAWMRSSPWGSGG